MSDQNSMLSKEEFDILIALKYDTCEAADKCEPCRGVREAAIKEIETLRLKLREAQQLSVRQGHTIRKLQRGIV